MVRCRPLDHEAGRSEVAAQGGGVGAMFKEERHALGNVRRLPDARAERWEAYPTSSVSNPVWVQVLGWCGRHLPDASVKRRVSRVVEDVAARRGAVPSHQLAALDEERHHCGLPARSACSVQRGEALHLRGGWREASVDTLNTKALFVMHNKCRPSWKNSTAATRLALITFRAGRELLIFTGLLWT